MFVKWLSNRTTQQLALLRLLAIASIFVPIGFFVTSAWAYLPLVIGFVFYTTIIMVDISTKTYKIAGKQIKKISKDVDSQMEQIFQHIRGERP